MPKINDKCRGCKTCMKACRYKAITLEHGIAVIDPQKCIDCKACLNNICPFEAIK